MTSLINIIIYMVIAFKKSNIFRSHFLLFIKQVQVLILKHQVVLHGL